MGDTMTTTPTHQEKIMKNIIQLPDSIRKALRKLARKQSGQ